MKKDDWVRMTLRLDPRQVVALDEWIRRQPDLPDRTGAIRFLLSHALRDYTVSAAADRAAKPALRGTADERTTRGVFPDYAGQVERRR